jgi:hypothetical protein
MHTGREKRARSLSMDDGPPPMRAGLTDHLGGVTRALCSPACSDLKRFTLLDHPNLRHDAMELLATELLPRLRGGGMKLALY